MYPSTKRKPKYCSQECSIKALGKPEIACKTCGNVFKASVHHGKYQQYCSVECRAYGQFKYPQTLRDEMLSLYVDIGAFEAARLLGVPEWYIRFHANRNGVQPNPNVRWQRFKDNPSQLETELYDALDCLQINYVAQHPIGHYIVDAFIAPNFIIEADGDWWHGHPRFEPLNERQKKQQAHDRSRNTYFTKRGYHVIRIWECDMSLETVEYVLSNHGLI